MFFGQIVAVLQIQVIFIYFSKKTYYYNTPIIKKNFFIQLLIKYIIFINDLRATRPFPLNYHQLV